MVTILVVEDEPAILENIREILEFEGYQTLCAEDGREAVDIARRQCPDLIVCDIMMPLMNGYGVLLALRSEPSTAKIPFIFLTAKADRTAMRYGMELGADDYISKPFNPTELINAITIRLKKQEALTGEYEKQIDELRNSVFTMLPHELRTPLLGIIGYSELLIMDAPVLDREQIIEMAQNIQRASQRLYRLIENFLMHAQLEIISSDPERQQSLRQFSIEYPDRVVERVVKEKANEHGREANLLLTLDSNVTYAQILEDDLNKIVSELVDNAFKFSEPDSVVQVLTEGYDGWYVISFSDYGRGMTPEQIDRVGAYMQFERKLYEQQGSGLGLIISRRLVELYGGQLQIESIPHQQTTVRVAVPQDLTDVSN
ncbi:MAG: response regulator [Anaerolineae bacterium]|nr:response regulator [Anaerolineae bacterium]